MKKLLSALFLLFVLVSHAQVDLQMGLKAYYPFKGNANDASGNNNAGSVSGALLTFDKYNSSNSAYSYYNLSDKIEVPYNTSLDISGTKHFSASIWIYPTSVNSLDGRLINFGSINGKSYELTYSSPTAGIDSGRIQFLNFSQTSSPKDVINIFSNTKVILNTWSLVIVTVDGNTGITQLYLNNALVASSSNMPVIPTSPTVTSPAMLTIGNHYVNNWAFKGTLDEVRIYNRILNASEISYLYSYYSVLNTTSNIMNVSVYPNPFTNRLYIEGASEVINSIVICDVFGKTILTDSFFNSKEIDMSSFAAGTYILRIVADKGTVVKKIQKI